MDTLPDKPTKHCSGCDLDLPAIREFFGANRSTKDGLARHCLECARAFDRKRPPRNQAISTCRRRRLRASQAKEAADYGAAIEKSKSAANEPHTSEMVGDFWEIQDGDRGTGILAGYLEDCKTCDNLDAVQKVIDMRLEVTNQRQRRLSQEELSCMTDDELAQAAQKILQGRG